MCITSIFAIFLKVELKGQFAVFEESFEISLMGKPKLLRRTSSLVQDAAESTKKVVMSHSNDSFQGHFGVTPGDFKSHFHEHFWTRGLYYSNEPRTYM